MPARVWAVKLLERKKLKVVAVALANKTVRIACAVLVRKQPYATPTVSRRVFASEVTRNVQGW
jgi:transposase